MTDRRGAFRRPRDVISKRGDTCTNDAQGEEENALHSLHWRYEGGALVADHAFLRGDRRIVANSSDGFKTCSLDIKVTLR